MTGIYWAMLASAQALSVVGIGFVMVGFLTGKSRGTRTGVVFLVAGLAAVPLGSTISPLAGVLLVAVTVASVWVVSRRLRALDQDTAAQQADA